METFYDQLRLTRHASFEDIRTVISQRRFELERTPADGRRQSLLDQLKAAERVLLDPQLRSRYDQDHFPGARGAAAPPLPKTAQPPALTGRPPTVIGQPPALAVQSPARPAQPPQIPFVPNYRTTCETCGTKLAPGARHCPVCGTEFAEPPASAAAAATSVGISVPALSNYFFDAVPSHTPDQLKAFFTWIGWSYARGTIVSADAPYLVDQEFILSRFLIKLGIFALIAWLVYRWLMAELGFLIIIAIIAVAFFMLLGGAMVLVLGSVFKLVTLFMPGANKEKKQVQVRDVRLRDDQLREYIVRFRGELRSGHISVGDLIEIWGANRGGTIMGRWGYNFRTKSRIWVKYQ